MRKRPSTLLAALLLSLLLHFIFVAGGEIGLPDFYSPPDEVLESSKPGQVQQVSLTKPPPAAASKPAGLQFIKAAPAKKARPARKKKPAPAPAKEEAPAPAAEEALPSVAP